MAVVAVRMPLLFFFKFILHLAFLSQFGEFVEWTANSNNRKNEATIYLMIILNDKRHFFVCLCVCFLHCCSFLYSLSSYNFSFVLFNFNVFNSVLFVLSVLIASNTHEKGGKIFTHCTTHDAELINSQIDKICVNQRRRAEQQWMWNSMANANQQNHQNESKKKTHTDVRKKRRVHKK